MKKMIAVATLFLSIEANAQGVNQLWGLSKGNGINTLSHLFSWDSATNNISDRKVFPRSLFSDVYPNFTIYDNHLYGVTEDRIFEWDLQFPQIPGIIKAAIGGIPNGNLVLNNNKFYGLTRSGGMADSGFLFEWDPSSYSVVEKIAFDFTKGSVPLGGLVFYNNKFYGMTAKGGSNNLGVIFEWDPATNDFIKKFDFDGANGASPNGNLTWAGSQFYGVTDSGGVNNAGVLFSWDPATGTFLKKVDFAPADGKNPCGTLLVADNRIYGMTTTGGANDLGVIFRWNISSGMFSKLIDLNDTEGGNPLGSMTQYNNNLYGITTAGLIAYDTITNTYLKKSDGHGNVTFNHPALTNGKLYFSSYDFPTRGIIEFDISGNTSKGYVTMDDFNSGSRTGLPEGLSERNGKLYGLMNDGGMERIGMVFGFDVADYVNPYKGLAFFEWYNTGAYPFGNPFSGMTEWGGWYDGGAHFGFSTNSNTITTGRHFDPIRHSISNPSSGKAMSGGYMMGSRFIVDPGTGDAFITAFNLGAGTGNPDVYSFGGNLIGVTDGGGGTFNMGYIFSFIPPDEWLGGIGVLENKFNFNGTDGASPNGTFTLLNNKYYGTTRLGGANDAGTLYEWDPINNVHTILAHFDGTTTGQVTSPLTVMNGKLYGMRSGGPNNKGMIFEFDPSTGIFTNKGVFDGITNGENNAERLVVAPAGIARSAPGSCVAFPSIAIDGTNNNKWVPIVDSHGDVLAEIKANGNNLGLLTIQSYVNAGPVRQDGEGHLYLDRNITITPAQQPAEGNPVDIRLYIPQSEFDALLNTGNAAIEDIDDVAIFKGNENCDNNVHNATPLSTTAESYVHGYVLKASIPSFSSFYFASNVFAVLPLQLLSFSGEIKNNDAQLTWTTVNEQNTAGFEIERSTTNNSFVRVGMVASNNTTGNHNYEFIDAGIDRITDSKIYYRIKLKDKNGKFTYSPTIVLQLNTAGTAVQFYPNPVNGRANLVITSNKSQLVQWRILDNSGKTFGRNVVQVNKGAVALPVEAGALPKGVYYLDIKGSNFSKLIKFVKQ